MRVGTPMILSLKGCTYITFSGKMCASEKNAARRCSQHRRAADGHLVVPKEPLMAYSGTSSVITAIPITPKQIERFWTKVSVRSDDECWLWTASLTPSGYGRVGIFGQTFYAHRVSDYIANGPPPPGIYICHTCDNPTCVNPRHLYRGTQKQNVRDREERGRGNRPRSPEVAKRNKRIAEKYKNGATLQELSDTFGLCISVCRRAVLKNGVPMRSTGRRKRVTS